RVWGACGRWFESSHPDKAIEVVDINNLRCLPPFILCKKSVETGRIRSDWRAADVRGGLLSSHYTRRF
ncbi:hypothetical protein, partial [Alloprevotella tannerae]